MHPSSTHVTHESSEPSSKHPAERPEVRVRAHVAKASHLPEAIAIDDAIAAAMGTLAERLTSGQAHRLLEGMPPALRHTLERRVLGTEGEAPVRMDRPSFVAGVAEQLGVTPAHAERVCEAVFAAVRKELPEGLVRDVAHQLPRALVQLWLAGPPRVPTASAISSAYDARRRVEQAIEAVGTLPSGLAGQDVFAAVMCAFSERLSGGEARALLLGLPETLRPSVARCMLHRGEQAFIRDRYGLFRRIEEHLHVDASRAEALVRAVLGAVRGILPEKAASDIESQIPTDLRELWQRE